MLKELGESIVNTLFDGAQWAAEKLASLLLEVIKILLKSIMWLIFDSSYWICLFAALAALFFYIAGMKKAGKYVGLSFLLYYVLQGIRVAIK
jgi:hypothetical protein